VPGQTLSAWAQDRPWREVLGAFLQAARGLAAAHSAGMVHRDFKPDNVLVGADGRARVADFGLAARTPEAMPDPASAPTQNGRGPATPSSMLDAQLSVTGLVMGTPFYMAPEVKFGERATAASDQFSYFKALQHLLTGRPRGEGADDVPGWVDAAIARGLREEPVDRWPDLAQVVRELEARLGVRPELDPRRGARARQVLMLGQMLLGLGATALASALGGEEVLSPKLLLILGVWQFAVAAAFISFGARWFAGSVVSQRVLAVVGLAVTGMLGNRALAYSWGTPGVQVLAIDLLLAGVVLVAAALFVQRWAASAALVAFAAAGVAGAWPARAPALFLLANAVVLAQAITQLRRPDRLKPGYLTDVHGA
jgi:serine/threonine-protein kinase